MRKLAEKTDTLCSRQAKREKRSWISKKDNFSLYQGERGAEGKKASRETAGATIRISQEGGERKKRYVPVGAIVESTKN